MYALATLIGFPTITAVVDDFLRRLRQNAIFANALPAGDVQPLRSRLVNFWSAILNGESWRLPLSGRGATNRLPALLADYHGVVLRLFHESIDRKVAPDLARAWHRRVDILQQSYPPAPEFEPSL